MTLRKLWLVLLVVAPLLNGCKEGVRVSFCVVDSANGMLRCSDPDQKPFDLPLAEADNWGCMAPADWERVLKDLVKRAPQMREEVSKKLSSNPMIKRRYAAYWSE